ncbi:MAG: hypothetical protein RL722_2295 [Pseudomonadota bacterium]
MLLVCLLGSLTSILGGCALPRNKAPVEDRGSSVLGPVVPPPLIEAPRAPAPAASHGPSSAQGGQAGYYTVRAGDTLIRVGLETGQNWRDIQRWNNLENPNLIEVGQVLRVTPPGLDASATLVRPVAASRLDNRTAASAPAGGASNGGGNAVPNNGAAPTGQAPLAGSSVVGATVAMPAVPVAATGTQVPASARDADDDMSWAWPAQGPVISSFDDARSKGVAIAGKAGDPVMAAADGKVVYAGSGLRGYGNLIIIKHNDTYLTAYAHNQTLQVKEDQPVRRGQKIAEMGSSDAERVQLHFEIRRKGKPVDPSRLLPGR